MTDRDIVYTKVKKTIKRILKNRRITKEVMQSSGM